VAGPGIDRTVASAVPTRVATGGTSVAIVAALEREIAPFVKGWSSSVREYDGRSYKVYQKENTIVVCGGVGAEAARRTAEAVIGLYQPGLLISAGFAGALDPSMSVGDTLTASQVIDAKDGSRMDSEAGSGILITFDTVADVEQKARFASAFGAHAIDMEAAAVGKSAQAHGIKFLACKVISDTSDTSLPPLTKFIGSDGRFHVLRYALHIAVRPWRWAAVRRLARDSMKAAQALGVSLEKHRRNQAI
jgi:adenosylhomocysteine nucleosidase